jgi:hypothetical protein
MLLDADDVPDYWFATRVIISTDLLAHLAMWWWRSCMGTLRTMCWRSAPIRSES